MPDPEWTDADGEECRRRLAEAKAKDPEKFW
jgi:hypothetical protein